MTLPMVSQIYSLPDLIKNVVPQYIDNIRSVLDKDTCSSIEHIYLTGCGDSYFAALGAQLAFRKLGRVNVECQTSMQFARYTSDSIINAESNLVIGASVSGEVSRTLEGLLMARQAGARVLAVTASPQSRIARAAHIIVDSTQPSFKDPEDLVVPGIRSFVANLISFYLIAIHIGEMKGNIQSEEALKLIKEIINLADITDITIRQNEEKALTVASNWIAASNFVFLGSGPNYASALFSAAKMLEASGDSALGQDMEEWAHLQYFERKMNIPTIVITAGVRDSSRALEILTAANAIGRSSAIIAPDHFNNHISENIIKFSIPDGVREMFQPVISIIPSTFLAAFKAELTHEHYFRDFSGGRSKEGGGGISRIRTSETISLENLKEENR